MNSLKPFPWQRLILAAIFVALITTVHFFLIPVLRPLDPQIWDSPIHLRDDHFAAQIQEEEKIGPVFYRGAPWRGRIGQWLSGCDARNSKISVVETIYEENCKNKCSGNGVCNYEFGRCNCFHGYAGKACQDIQELECNLPATDGMPYGGWRVSICPAHCDKRTTKCFCGAASKYPERPLAESCGFVINGVTVDWSKNDFSTVYANSSEKVGWCNVDPADFYSGKVSLKQHCDCKYDCNWGVLCEIPTECSCVNQCSGNGFCRSGFCQCNAGWYGIDCSIPSITRAFSAWPDWLQKSALDSQVNKFRENGTGLFQLSIQKRRPFIYIYDLPPEFNSHLLEGRHFRFQCVNRLYDGINATIWTDQLYGAEMALLESFLSSPYRTTNGDEADFFYVPVLGACAITLADEAPHFSMQDYMGLRGYFSGDMYKRAYEYISKSYPFWNRSGGHDHLWFFPWDEGACSAPKEIWNSTMLVHWGNTNSKHKTSTTAYEPDSWDPIPKEWRGLHPCYDPGKDIVLPAWKVPNPSVISRHLWAKPRKERKILFYFNGNLGNAYENGRYEERYSMGIRQKLANEFGSSPNKEGKLGRQAESDVIVTSKRSPDYALELSSSRFCGVLPGDGWSGRMEDSILHGCIPVIIQDGIYLPYEGFLSYKSFAVRVAEDEIPQMVSILRNFTDEEVDTKLEAVRGLWQRFIYKDSIMLEATRQKEKWKYRPDWTIQYETVEGDDVFATLIQILHYKSHNDKWLVTLDRRRQVGISRNCSLRNL